MKKILLSVCVFAITANSFAQQFQENLILPYPAQAVNIIRGVNGGYYLSANAEMGIFKNFLLVRLNDAYQIQWTKLFTIANHQASLSDIAQAGDGSLYVTGTDTGQYEKVVIMKLDTGGNQIWIKWIFIGDRWDGLGKILIAPGGNIYLLGGTSIGPYISDVEGGVLVKMNPLGVILWKKFVQGSAGGNNNRVTGLIFGYDKQLMVFGYNSGLNGGAIMLMKVDTGSGASLWQEQAWSGTNGFPSGAPLDLISDGQTGLYFNLSEWANEPSWRSYIVHMDSLSTFLPSKYFEEVLGTDTLITGVKQMIHTSDGGYALAGRVVGTVANPLSLFILKRDNQMNPQWEKFYQLNSHANTFWATSVGAIVQTPDDGFLMCATQADTSGNDYITLIKTNSNGETGCDEATPVVIAKTYDFSAISSFLPFVSVVSTIFLVSDSISNVAASFDSVCESEPLITENLFTNEKIILFPNPAHDEIHFQIDEANVEAQLFIYDLFGREVHSVKVGSEEISVDVSQLVNGVYTYKMIVGEKIFRGKFEKM